MAGEVIEVKLDIPKYDKWEGIRVSWVDLHEIEVVLEDGEVFIWANQEGLTTLATQMLTLAQDDIPPGRHIHLSSSTGLDQGSLALTLGKKGSGKT